jgi:hypothetical protein
MLSSSFDSQPERPLPGATSERESVNSPCNSLLQKLAKPLKLELAAVNPA